MSGPLKSRALADRRQASALSSLSAPNTARKTPLPRKNAREGLFVSILPAPPGHPGERSRKGQGRGNDESEIKSFSGSHGVIPSVVTTPASPHDEFGALISVNATLAPAATM